MLLNLFFVNAMTIGLIAFIPRNSLANFANRTIRTIRIILNRRNIEENGIEEIKSNQWDFKYLAFPGLVNNPIEKSKMKTMQMAKSILSSIFWMFSGNGIMTSMASSITT